MELAEAKKTQFAPGATLQNSRTCLLYDDDGQHTGAALGHLEGEVMPYATWMVYWTVNDGRWFGKTVHGNYFQDFEEAYADYCYRRDRVRGDNILSGVV